MAHIHTEPGQIDYIAEVFIVYQNKVLIRLHDKIKKWIAPGGHVELNETPEEAAVREVKEEVGLDVELYSGNKIVAENGTGRLAQLIPPVFMNIHDVSEDHRHLVLVYFATSKTDIVIQPENQEKTNCRWMTREEIMTATDMEDTIKSYALEALKRLAE